MADNKAVKYAEEFRTWRNHLRVYWPQIVKNQELYEFYKRDEEETESQISLNTPFSIVESMVAKANDTTLNVTVRAKGTNGLTDFESWVSAVLKDAIDDPDVARYHGTFRKAKERFFREFLVKGNAVATTEFCYKTDKDGKTVADNPYVNVRDLLSVVFNPSKTIADSDVYYLESYVKYSQLKNNEYNEGIGKYKNLKELKALAEEDGKLIDDTEEMHITNGGKVGKKVEPIHILERWEGTKYTVIADDRVIIQELDDPFKTGGHNLLIGMNYVVGSRPYAYGEIDAIYGTVRAQDTIINQNLDIINRYLRPAILVDPNGGMDIDQLIILVENGGVMYGNPTAVGNVPSQTPPAQAFTTIDIMQQAIERTARFSPYASGMSSQATDKTQGTMGGIQSLQAAAEPNFQVKIDALQDQFAKPMARNYLKMIAGLMGSKEVRYGLLQGRSPEWVKVTKGILQGKTTLTELVSAGIIKEEVALPYMQTTEQYPDEYGNIQTAIVAIPGADKAILFDVDWLLDVSLDNQSAVNKDREVAMKQGWVKWAQSLGVQFDPVKTATEIGRELGIDDPEDLYVQRQGMGMPPEVMGMPPSMPPQGMGMPPEAGNIGAEVAA